jgi:tetratricopeptide (TPR) repeat protein
MVASVTSYERAAELGDRLPWFLGWLGLACGAAGRHDRARALLDELLALSASTYVPPFSIGVISLGLGEIDSAFRWLDRAVDVRDPLVIPILSYPFLDPVRGDARYRSLLVKMNLADCGAECPYPNAT